MINKLIFASHNRHKIEEIKVMLQNQWELLTLSEAGIEEEIPEPHDTLEENATEKSMHIFKLTGMNCFSEDTGLEVLSLNGAPGVKTARYAGEERSFEKNIQKLLTELEAKSSREARFRSVISLILDGREHQFEGICTGTIAARPRGQEGFGYDPVFIPDGEQRTFAEMSLQEKNRFNHRRKAFDKLQEFLSAQ